MKHAITTVLMTLLAFAVCTVGMAADYENKVLISNPDALELYGPLIVSIETLDPRMGEIQQPVLDYPVDMYSIIQMAVITPTSACDSKTDCDAAVHLLCWMLGEEVASSSFSLTEGCKLTCTGVGQQEVSIECVVLEPTARAKGKK